MWEDLALSTACPLLTLVVLEAVWYLQPTLPWSIITNTRWWTFSNGDKKYLCNKLEVLRQNIENLFSQSGVRTLQEIVRNHLVLENGLERLSRMVKRDQILPQLPPCIRHFLLTFPCADFEVKKSSWWGSNWDFQETSDVSLRPPLAASYHVRCKLDRSNYLAIFATSEMDKVGRIFASCYWLIINGLINNIQSINFIHI